MNEMNVVEKEMNVSSLYKFVGDMWRFGNGSCKIDELCRVAGLDKSRMSLYKIWSKILHGNDYLILSFNLKKNQVRIVGCSTDFDSSNNRRSLNCFGDWIK